MQQMFIPFFLGVGGPLASGRQPFPWVHVFDVAGLITFAIENTAVQGVVNAVAPDMVNNGQFARALGAAMWRPAIIPVPKFALNVLLGPERAQLMTTGAFVKPTRALEAGYEFEVPCLRDACLSAGQLLVDDEVTG